MSFVRAFVHSLSIAHFSWTRPQDHRDQCSWCPGVLHALGDPETLGESRPRVLHTQVGFPRIPLSLPSICLFDHLQNVCGGAVRCQSGLEGAVRTSGAKVSGNKWHREQISGLRGRPPNQQRGQGASADGDTRWGCCGSPGGSRGRPLLWKLLERPHRRAACQAPRLDARAMARVSDCDLFTFCKLNKPPPACHTPSFHRAL